MDSPEPPPRLLPTGSALDFRDFLLSTGLAEDVAAELVRAGRLRGVFVSEDGRPQMLAEESLPTRAELVAMGLSVHEDYDPAHPRHGGVDCPVHGWAPAFLRLRYDEASGREVPDGLGCWECEQAGVSRR